MERSPATPRSATMRGAPLGAGLSLLAAFCFGTLGPLSRFAEEAGVGPLALVAWRAGLGAASMVVFIALLSMAGRSAVLPLGLIPARERWALAATSLVNAVLNLSVFMAFGRISIALALLVFYLYPALVALTSVLWFGERLDRLRWTALAVSFIGLLLVLVGAGPIGSLDALGIGLAFVGAVGQVFYVLAARHGFARVPGPQAAALTMVGAMVLYAAFALAIGQAAILGHPLRSLDSFWPVLLAGVVGAGIPTVCYITGIRLLGAPRAAILATFEPVVGVGLAALLLGEEPTAMQVLGGLLILSAATLLQLRPQAEAVDHEAISG